jgi:hypothetical protein
MKENKKMKEKNERKKNENKKINKIYCISIK